MPSQMVLDAHIDASVSQPDANSVRLSTKLIKSHCSFYFSFEEIDTDESGEISRGELEKYMKEKNYKPGMVEKWMRIFDIDNSGAISLEEFCTTLGLVPSKKQKERIQRRKSLKLIELETKNQNKSNEENTEISDSSSSNSKTISKSMTVIIENSKYTTTQSFNGPEKNNSIENETRKDSNQIENDKLKEMDKQDQNSDQNSISYDHVISLSSNLDKADSNGKSKLSTAKSPNEINQKETETKESIEEYERMITRFKRIIIPNDEIYVISEDPDMTDSLRNFVLNMSLDSARRFDEPLEMAKCIKRILDFNFNRSWHVVAGKDSYGCLVTHEEGRFIHVRARQWGILMWQIFKI